jgi:ATP-dependent protease HslVU (ClpYQ) peptidase subunit
MTTIAVVRKGGQVAIAADTLTKWGAGKESAEYVVNHEKILKVGANYIAITGSATFKIILRDYFSQPENAPNLDNALEIFRSWNRLHSVLKERYFLMAEEDKEDALESTRMDILIANPYGIFGVAAHRTVQEFSKFYASGSGSDYALGALYACYDRPGWDAKKIARYGIDAAAEFDDGTGAPVDCFGVKLRASR